VGGALAGAHYARLPVLRHRLRGNANALTVFEIP